MGSFELPGWANGDCLLGIGHRCLIRSELRSFAQRSTVKLKLADPVCLSHHFGVCFQKAAHVPATPIFNFSVFVTALTLLVIVFTITDTKFKFRVAVAPVPLIAFSAFYLGICGIAVLLSDFAFNQDWEIPRAVNSDVFWQVASGGAFLLLVFLWVFVAFLRPPTFGRLNAYKFTSQVYLVVLTGNNSEITAVAHELARSARAIIKYAGQRRPRPNPLGMPKKVQWLMDRVKPKAMAIIKSKFLEKRLGRELRPIADHATSVLLLMGDRRFCAAVAAGAPRTAIAIFQEMAKQERYFVPVRPFSINVSQEAIANNQSLLYHEGDGYSSGALGYWKPFSAAIYGNYELVEALGQQNGSPLDIGYLERNAWDADQFEAYTRAVLITFNSYLKNAHWRTHSNVLRRAISTISERAGKHNFYLADQADVDIVNSDAVRKLDIGVRFAKELVRAIEKLPDTPKTFRLKRDRDRRREGDFYDEIAELIYSLIQGASGVRSERASWSIQHNAVWAQFFGFEEGKVWRIIQFKVRRLIYDEIAKDKFFNFLNSRIFGMTINVVGWRPWVGQRKSEAALRKVMTSWAKKNLMKLVEDNPEIVISGLPARLTLDVSLRRLLRAYPKGLSRKPTVTYLQLD